MLLLQNTDQCLPKPGRVGILPYTVIDNRLYVLLGLDRASGDYSDFGGGRKNNETFLQGSLREGAEETEQLIKYQADNITSYLATWTTNMGIIFLPLKLQPYQLSSLERDFAERVRANSEMKAIKWLDWASFLQTVQGNLENPPKMYSRVRTLLQYCLRVYELSVELLDHWTSHALAVPGPEEANSTKSTKSLNSYQQPFRPRLVRPRQPNPLEQDWKPQKNNPDFSTDSKSCQLAPPTKMEFPPRLCPVWPRHKRAPVNPNRSTPPAQPTVPVAVAAPAVTAPPTPALVVNRSAQLPYYTFGPQLYQPQNTWPTPYRPMIATKM